MMKNETSNCQACGNEDLKSNLKTVMLCGFNKPIHICSSCVSRTAEDAFKDAASILNEIIIIAVSDSDPENRLDLIKNIFGE